MLENGRWNLTGRLKGSGAEVDSNCMLQFCIWQIFTQPNEEIEQKVIHTKLQHTGHHLLDFPMA
jgi:hypothetical protein